MFYVEFTGSAQTIGQEFESREEAEEYYNEMSECGERPVGWEWVDGNKIDLFTGEEITE